MSLLLFAAQIVTTVTPACSQVRDRQNAEALELQKKVEVLFEERKGSVAQRAAIAKQRMKNAEKGYIERSFKEALGGSKSDESLDRRDAAYQARLNSISDEGQVISGELQLMKIKHEAQLATCSADK